MPFKIAHYIEFPGCVRRYTVLPYFCIIFIFPFNISSFGCFTFRETFPSHSLSILEIRAFQNSLAFSRKSNQNLRHVTYLSFLFFSSETSFNKFFYNFSDKKHLPPWNMGTKGLKIILKKNYTGRFVIVILLYVFWTLHYFKHKTVSKRVEDTVVKKKYSKNSFTLTKHFFRIYKKPRQFAKFVNMPRLMIK